MTSIILIIIVIAIIEAIYKKVDVFNEFISGVKEGMQLLLTIFPTMMAFMLWVVCFQTCGITNILEYILAPIFYYLQIPIEVLMMMLIRPFSYNGSMSIMTSIFTTYGIDHPYSLLASIIQTGSDTTFYVVTLYFSSIKLTNYRYALKLGLWLDFIACLLALFCYHMFMI
jgi:spore maturation protein B